MSRTLLLLPCLCLLALADGTAKRPATKPIRLVPRIRTGQRFTASNTIAFKVTTVVKQGQQRSETTASVQRTERYVDTVLRAGAGGSLEIERSFLRLYSKVRSSDQERPSVYQSPLQGRTLILKETRRRRDLKLKGQGVIDPLVRRTAGMDLDWRDIFPEDPVSVGDTWKADVGSLARRLASHLESGRHSLMKVRFEDVVERDGARLAQLYIDWTLTGNRDRHLYTKVTLSGDVYFDLTVRRLVEIDLAGKLIVRGTILGKGAPQIVKGEGPVEVKGELKLVPEVDAAADGE